MPSRQKVEGSWERDVSLSRLNHRAWVLQEQMLSANVLYFGQTELHWTTGGPRVDGVERTRENQLATSLRQDMFDARPSKMFTNVPIGRHIYLDDEEYFLNERVSGLLSAADVEAKNHLSRPHIKPWWDMVELYTQRSMTRPEDKLIAISGIASFVQQESAEEFPLDYVAGIWSQSLTSGLLGYVDKDRPLSRPSKYRASSWSWAAVDGVITNDSLELGPSTSGLEILEQMITGPSSISNDSDIGSSLVAPDREVFPMSLITEDSYLRVRGKLKQATWRKANQDENDLYYMRQTVFREELTLGDLKKTREPISAISHNPDAGVEAYHLCTTTTSSASHTYKDIGYFLPDTTTDDLPQDIYCLQIKVEPASDLGKNDLLRVWAVRRLALTPTGRAENEFTRVGYFELERKGEDLRWPDIATGRLSHRNVYDPIRRWPDVDPHGFFGEGCEEKEIVLR